MLMAQNSHLIERKMLFDITTFYLIAMRCWRVFPFPFSADSSLLMCSLLHAVCCSTCQFPFLLSGFSISLFELKCSVARDACFDMHYQELRESREEGQVLCKMYS